MLEKEPISFVTKPKMCIKFKHLSGTLSALLRGNYINGGMNISHFRSIRDSDTSESSSKTIFVGLKET